MKRIGRVPLFVSDLQRSRKFYEDVLELHHSETHGPDDHAKLRDLNANLCFMAVGVCTMISRWWSNSTKVAIRYLCSKTG